MALETLLGSVAVISAGLVSGSGAWPMKLMKHYRFEHWWFVGMFTGLILVPWLVAFLFCPNLTLALGSVPWRALVVANLWAAGWGVANILCGLCYVEIGLGLTTAIIAGFGVCLGVALPLAVKGSGLFQGAPDLGSRAGLTVLAGAAIALFGVVLAAHAGAGRERAQRKMVPRSKTFSVALLAAMTAGVLSCGMNLAFVYGQGAIMAAVKQQGAGDIPAIFAVWAAGLLSGALVSVGYAVLLLTRNRSWSVLLQNPKECLLAVIIGLNLSLSTVLVGHGMLLLGALGASVGGGLSLISWMLGGQVVGFLTGEWRAATGRVRRQMAFAVGLLGLAALIMVCGNLFARV
jgi:L-rhamnose-H+ transport protein